MPQSRSASLLLRYSWTGGRVYVCARALVSVKKGPITEKGSETDSVEWTGNARLASTPEEAKVTSVYETPGILHA